MVVLLSWIIEFMQALVFSDSPKSEYRLDGLQDE